MADVTQPASNQPDLGKVLTQWDFPEFVKYEHTRLWYVGALSIAALLIIFAVATQNYLFIVLIVLFGLIIYLRDRREPETLTISIQERGISIGERLRYTWKDINSFWIIYEPPEVKNLYIDFKGIRPDLTVFLQDNNPLEIRKLLAQYIPEDLEKENESFSDGVSRMFKF